MPRLGGFLLNIPLCLSPEPPNWKLSWSMAWSQAVYVTSKDHWISALWGRGNVHMLLPDLRRMLSYFGVNHSNSVLEKPVCFGCFKFFINQVVTEECCQGLREAEIFPEVAYGHFTVLAHRAGPPCTVRCSALPPPSRWLRIQWGPGCWKLILLFAFSLCSNFPDYSEYQDGHVKWLTLRCFHSPVNFNLNSFLMFDTLVKNSSVKHPASEWLSYHPSCVIPRFLHKSFQVF